MALGTSETPMGAKEQVPGLNQLPLAQGGRVVEVYQTGQPYWSGQVLGPTPELLQSKIDQILARSNTSVMVRGEIGNTRAEKQQ